MVINAAQIIDTLLGLSLIAMAAAIHFRPRRRGRQVRQRVRIRVSSSRRLHLRLRWLPLPLAAIGLILIGTSWLWASKSTPETSPVVAVVPEPAPTDPAEATARGMVLVRATPSDDDSATEDDIRSYSQRLGTLVGQTLARPPLSLHLEPDTIDAEQWKAIREDPSRTGEWCRKSADMDFVAVVGMEALRLEKGAGFAPWREPEYVVMGCATLRHAVIRGRIDERLGDRVPYEQAIVDDLKSALGKLVTQPD